MGPPIRPCACPSCLSASACVCVSGVWPKSVSVSACVCVSGVWPLCTQDILLADAARSLEAAKRAALRTFSWRVGRGLSRNTHSGHSPASAATPDLSRNTRSVGVLRTFSWRIGRGQPQHPASAADILLRNTPSVSVLRTSSWRVGLSASTLSTLGLRTEASTEASTQDTLGLRTVL